MSALSSLVRDPLARSTSERSRPPRLSLVTTPLARMAGFPFILLVAGILAMGMLGLLLLNTTLQTRAFQVRELRAEATVLAFNQSELESKVARAGSPEVLARRASALGMRPNPYPAFVELPSGKILGKPKKVTGTEMSSMTIKDSEASTTATDPQVQAQSPARLAAERVAKDLEKQKAAEEKKTSQRADKKAADKAEKPKSSKKSETTKPGTKKSESKKSESKKSESKKAQSKKTEKKRASN